MFDDSVESYAVAARGDQWRVGAQFGQHVVVRVVGIEEDEDALRAGGEACDLAETRQRG